MGVLSQVDQPVNTFDVLDSGVEQLKEEHAVLKSKLLELYVSAQLIGKDCTEPDWRGFLRKHRDHVAVLMRELACHSGWEDEVLLPVIAGFTGIKKVEVMGYDYEIGIWHMRQFLNFVENLRDPVRFEDVKLAAGYLIKAYHALNERFKIEEEVLFPLAEEMLTDMEQFYS